MAYVREHGNQLAIVHGARDPETRKVRQRVLFTLYSRPEAEAAVGSERERLHRTLEARYPQIRFDWEKIDAGIRQRIDQLPDSYPYRTREVLGRFRHDLCTFVRQLGLADPQRTWAAAEVIQQNRVELEYLRELIDWRLRTCDQEPNAWNGDNAFYWRQRLQADDVPGEVIERMARLYAERDLDRLEALARLFLETYSDYADGHNYLGLAAQERGDLDEAIAHFERAVVAGRKLFPKRLARSSFWVDLDTRPYMRGLRYLAIARMRRGLYDEALDACARLDRECGDDRVAASFRARIYLNMGRWDEARRQAEQVADLWPEQTLLVALAAAEQGDEDGAIRAFLRGLRTCPRTAHLLLDRPMPRPEGRRQVDDHNLGVDTRTHLEPALDALSPRARRLLEAVLDAPDAIVEGVRAQLPT